MSAAPLTQQRRIAMILGVALIGAFIGPFGLLALGLSKIEGRRLEGIAPDTLARLWEGVTTAGPVMAFAGCSLVATLLFAPWFVSSIDRLAQAPLSRGRFYWLAATRGIALGMLATTVNTALVLLAASLVNPEKVAAPGTDGPLMLIGGVLLFGTFMGMMFAVVALPVIVPIGGALGMATGWIRNRIASAA